MKRRLLITFSGVDGAGKSTQMDLLAGHLRSMGEDFEMVWHRPGCSTRMNRARALVRRLRPEALPTTENPEKRAHILSKPSVQRLWVLLATFGTFIEYALKLRWSAKRHRIIICDRYLPDALLDLKLNFPNLDVERSLPTRLLQRTVPRPDLPILLMLPLDESLRRVEMKDEPFPDPPQIRAARFREYQHLGEAGEGQLLDASRRPDEVHADILALLRERW